MKNKTKQIFIFKRVDSNGEVVSFGCSNHRLLINVWYMLNKKVTDGRIYYVEDEDGKSYASCPCPMKLLPTQIIPYLKHMEKLQDENKGVDENV